MTVLAVPLGFRYDDLEKKASESLSGVLTTLFIIFAIGGLIGTWMASGTVPAIIYYGMNIMSAKFFLPAALVLCSIVSVATGTSWGTLGTIRVALVGIGAGLGIPAGMTAGAAICGAWFGDKVSPLSDTTNFTAAIVGTPLMTHIKHMMYTTGPAYILTAIIFTVLGLRVSMDSSMDVTLIAETQSGIAANFHLGFPVLIPILIVFIMLLMRKNPTISLLAGSLAGIVVAVVYQGSATGPAFNSLYNGFSGTFENEFLTSLLNRGGIVSMLGKIIAVFNGVTFAGISIFLRLQKDGNPVMSMFLGNVLSAVIGVPFMVSAGPPDFSSFLFLLLAGGLAALSYSLYAMASTGLSALETVLIPIIDPTMNPVWVFLFLGEAPGIMSIAGAVVVLVSVTVRVIYGIKCEAAVKTGQSVA